MGVDNQSMSNSQRVNMEIVEQLSLFSDMWEELWERLWDPTSKEYKEYDPIKELKTWCQPKELEMNVLWREIYGRDLVNKDGIQQKAGYQDTILRRTKFAKYKVKAKSKYKIDVEII